MLGGSYRNGLVGHYPEGSGSRGFSDGRSRSDAAAPVEAPVDPAAVRCAVETDAPQELRIDGGLPLLLGDEPHVLHRTVAILPPLRKLSGLQRGEEEAFNFVLV